MRALCRNDFQALPLVRFTILDDAAVERLPAVAQKTLSVSPSLFCLLGTARMTN
jgi:hypothetical protein